MAFKSADVLIDEFRRDWEAAMMPCASCLIACCAPAEREALRDLLDTAMMTWPTPAYSDAQLARLREKVSAILGSTM